MWRPLTDVYNISTQLKGGGSTHNVGLLRKKCKSGRQHLILTHVTNPDEWEYSLTLEVKKRNLTFMPSHMEGSYGVFIQGVQKLTLPF